MNIVEMGGYVDPGKGSALVGGEMLAGLRLLVVEDEALIALTLEDMLFNLGCTVVGVAGTAARAVALAADRSLSIDGAILDVNLGGETVYPAAQRLLCRGVPFVFCTGYGKAGIAAEFAHVPTLDKPYFEDQLRELIVAGLIAPNQHGLASGRLERPCPE